MAGVHLKATVVLIKASVKVIDIHSLLCSI